MNLWNIKLFISLPLITQDSLEFHPYLMLTRCHGCLHSLLLKPQIMISLTQDLSVPLVSVSAYEPEKYGLRAQFEKESNLIGTNRYRYPRSLSLGHLQNADQLLVFICGTVFSRSLKPYWLNTDFCDHITISRE